MLICPAFAASSFPDVDENAEYAEAVEYLKDAGIMNGDDQGNFNPNKTVTRAEMATIICNMLGETENLAVSNTFSDVPTTHWANKYITRAAELNFVSGYGNGNFGPDDTVTYEQAVTMVVSAGYGAEESQAAGGYPDGFLHMAEIYGLLEGISIKNGTLLTRAQTAMIVYNYCYSFIF